MALIRPSAELRNNYNEISKICHETNEPVYITRNGANDLVVLSDIAYEEMKKISMESEEDKIDRLISEKFDRYYSDFEDFRTSFIENIVEAIKEIDEGKTISMEKIVAEMEEKYHIN